MGTEDHIMFLTQACEARGMMWGVASFAHLVAHPLDERGGGVLPGEKKALKLDDTAAY